MTTKTSKPHQCELPSCIEIINSSRRKYCQSHMYKNGCLKSYALKLLGRVSKKKHITVDKSIKYPFQCMEVFENEQRCERRFKSEEWRNVHMLKDHGHFVSGCSRMNPELEAKKDFTRLYIRKISSQIKSKSRLLRVANQKIELYKRQIDAITEKQPEEVPLYQDNKIRFELLDIKSKISYQRNLAQRYMDIIAPYKNRLKFLCNHAVEIGGYSMDDIAKKYGIIFNKKYYDDIAESNFLYSSLLGEEIASRIM